MTSLKKLIIISVGMAIFLFCFLAMLFFRHVSDAMTISTAWVISDPLYRETSEFEFQGYCLGQGIGYYIDLTDATADYYDVKLPEFITSCELDSKGRIISLVGHDSLKLPRRYKIFVRKEGNLVKLYEGDYVDTCSVSPDMKYVAIHKVDDVVFFNIEDGMSFSSGITEPLEGVMPCWYSNNEILISVDWDKIIRYDINSKTGSVVLEGSSPVKWRDRILFQRNFRYHNRDGTCQFYVLDKLGGKEELLFEMQYITGPISMSPDGNFLCCQASYQYLQKDFAYKLCRGNSLYIRNMNDGTFTFYTDNPLYVYYWTWEKSETGSDEK